MFGTTSKRRVKSQAESISETQWNALTADLPVRPHMGVDRRQHRRVVRRDVAQVLVGIGPLRRPKHRYLVRSRDISEGGFGFLHSQSIERGTRCQVNVLNSKKVMVKLRGRICSSNDLGNGVWAIGIKFDHSITLKDHEKTRKS